MEKRKKEGEYVIGSNGCLVCEYVIATSGEHMVKQFFGDSCEIFRNRYGAKCHNVCRMFKQDYVRLRSSFNSIAAGSIMEMDEQMILLGEDKADAIIFNARMQAQILEIDSPYNAHWTRVNLGLGKHHKIKAEELSENFFKHEAPLDFPVRWGKMLEEIRADLNVHYAREKFETPNPCLKELFWTYRFGRAIEYFGKNHPNLFRAGHAVTV